MPENIIGTINTVLELIIRITSNPLLVSILVVYFGTYGVKTWLRISERMVPVIPFILGLIMAFLYVPGMEIKLFSFQFFTAVIFEALKAAGIAGVLYKWERTVIRGKGLKK